MAGKPKRGPKGSGSRTSSTPRTLPFPPGLLSAEFRADLRRPNRFAAYDRQWLRAVHGRRTPPGARPAGKFYAGRKLYAGRIAGAVPTTVSTGLPMWFTGLLPLISGLLTPNLPHRAFLSTIPLSSPL